MRNQPTVNTSVWTPDGQLYVTQGDRLYIDPELNTASRNPYGAATDDDLHDVSQLILIEGRFYDLSVSPAGDKLSLEPSDVAVGYVSNPNQWDRDENRHQFRYNSSRHLRRGIDAGRDSRRIRSCSARHDFEPRRHGGSGLLSGVGREREAV